MRKTIVLFVSAAFVLGANAFTAAQTAAPAPQEKKVQEKKIEDKGATDLRKGAGGVSMSGLTRSKAKADCEKAGGKDCEKEGTSPDQTRKRGDNPIEYLRAKPAPQGNSQSGTR